MILSVSNARFFTVEYGVLGTQLMIIPADKVDSSFEFEHGSKEITEAEAQQIIASGSIWLTAHKEAFVPLGERIDE